MGNKINPHGLRIGINKEHSSKWFAGSKTYSKLLVEDSKIRKIVQKELANAGLAAINIERAAHQVNVTVKAAKPGIVIGQNGANIKKLRDDLSNVVGGTSTVAVNVEEVPNANTSAPLVAQRIAEQIERRFAYKRAMQQAVQKVMESGAKGCKIVVSGRLGGAEQGRKETRMEGRVPLHTLRADLDYGFAEATTTYGKLGIKVIVFNGEVIGKQDGIRPSPRPMARGSENKSGSDERRNRDNRSRPGARARRPEKGGA
ncbi:MAG: 30S ribosomal protein S3 [Deinococcales bacterium]